MISPSSRPTNDVTELAKERNRQAVERTIASWINSALLLIGLGISIHEIASEVQQGSPNPLADNVQLNDFLSLGAIALGITLLIPIVITHRANIQTLDRGDYLAKPPQIFNLTVIVAVVIVFGLMALVDVLIVTPGS